MHDLGRRVAVHLAAAFPRHGANLFVGAVDDRRMQAFGDRDDRLDGSGDGARRFDDDLVRKLVPQIGKLVEHFLRRAIIQRTLLADIGKALRILQDLAEIGVALVDIVDVARGSDGLSELFAKLDDPPVDGVQILHALQGAVSDHEHIVAVGLNFKIVVECGDALLLLFARAASHGGVKLAVFAGRADDEILPQRGDAAFGHARAAVEILKVRLGDQFVQIAQTVLVFGKQHDVMRIQRGDDLFFVHARLDVLDALPTQIADHVEQFQ